MDSRADLKRDREDSSSESDDEVEMDNENKYLKNPTEKEFNSKVIDDYIEKIKKIDNNIVLTVDEFNLQKRKFQKDIIKRFNYVQYNYKKPIKFLIKCNSYGVCVSNSEDFSDKTIMENFNSLEAKHRAAILMPSMKHNWHEPSNALFTAVVEGFVMDLRKLVTKNNAAFNDSLDSVNFKMNNLPKNIDSLRNKFLKGSIIKQGKMMPSVFGVRLFTSQVPPVKFQATLIELKGGELSTSKWEKLAKPGYMHSVQIIKLSGFKITKTGISLDLSIDCSIIKRIKEEVEESIYATALGKPKKTKCDESSDDDSSDDDEDISKCAF